MRHLAMLSTAAFLTLCAPAAANRWYIEDGPHGQRHRIEPGGSVEVPIEGAVNVKAKLVGRRGAVRIACATAGSERLGDPSETEALATSTSWLFACEGASVVSVSLPWTGGLGGNCQPCTIARSESLEVTVGGVDYGVFSGTVTTRIGDFDDPIKDDIDHIAVLNSKSGKLRGPSGTLQLAGRIAFGSEATGDRADGEPNGAAAEEEGEGA